MTEYDADAYGFYLVAENFNHDGQLALFYNKRLRKYSENRVNIEKVSQKESRVIVDRKVVWEGDHETAALKAGKYAKEIH